MERNKICVLKMGGECNLNCTHCHSKKVKYKFNPEIIPFLKNNGFYRITFSGGEPLMYFDIMKRVCEELGHDFQYKFVTNTTLLTEEMVKFFNGYNFMVCGSFDGSDGCRSTFPRPRYDLLAKIKRNTLAITVYEENNNLNKLKKEVDFLIGENRLNYRQSLAPEFIHQTADVSENTTTLETAKRYISQMAPMIENELIAFMKDDIRSLKKYGTLFKAVMKWWVKKDYKGLRCINERVIPMSIDGRFLACPYGTYFVGDIKSGIDWDAIDALTPKKCKVCPIQDVCKGACWVNKTNQECYIARTMNKWLNKLVANKNAAEKLQIAIDLHLVEQRRIDFN